MRVDLVGVITRQDVYFEQAPMVGDLVTAFTGVKPGLLRVIGREWYSLNDNTGFVIRNGDSNLKIIVDWADTDTVIPAAPGPATA
jgi:hypothetical protein